MGPPISAAREDVAGAAMVVSARMLGELAISGVRRARSLRAQPSPQRACGRETPRLPQPCHRPRRTMASPSQNDRLGKRPSATAATPPSPSYVAAVRAAWTTTRASRPPRRARGRRAARPAPRVSEPRIASWTSSSTPPRMPCCSSPVAWSRRSIAPMTDRSACRRPGSAFASSRADTIVSTSLDGHQFHLDATEDCRARGSFPEVAIRRAGVLTRPGVHGQTKCGGISYADT
jgi:hypothetical protein